MKTDKSNHFQMPLDQIKHVNAVTHTSTCLRAIHYIFWSKTLTPDPPHGNTHTSKVHCNNNLREGHFLVNHKLIHNHFQDATSR